jgi:ataxia telangiectasia mutated family protein
VYKKTSGLNFIIFKYDRHLHDMKLDYLKVAKAAHFCTAHFTALLYAEFWCQEQINQEPSDDSVSTSSYTKLDSVYERVDEVTGNALQNILRQVGIHFGRDSS